MNAVDTNVLAYFVDRNEPVKRQKAIQLLRTLITRRDPPILLWQVAVEYVACLKRWQDKGILTSAEVHSNWTLAHNMLDVVLPQTNLVPQVFDLMDRHSLSFWDALLLTACIEAGVDTLYSEDLSHGATYDSVKVVNPFA